MQSRPFLGWFTSKGYAQGVFWAIMTCMVAVTIAILMRFLGKNLNPIEIVFFRFLFSTITVVPLILNHGTSLFKTQRPGLHFWRAVLGAGAIGASCFSVNLMSLADTTTIMFSRPLFFLLMAALFLQEKVDLPRWLTTLSGFIGLIIIVQPGGETFSLVAFIPMVGALLFASLDIMAKKMLATEKTYTIMFYFAIGTTLTALIPAIYVWKTPTLIELGLLVLLGIGANLIQFTVLRAFSSTDASALMPFRYLEYIFAAFFGYMLFSEVPSPLTAMGAVIIIAATLFLSYWERKKEIRNQVRDPDCLDEAVLDDVVPIKLLKVG